MPTFETGLPNVITLLSSRMFSVLEFFSYPLNSLPPRHISHLGQNRGWEKKVAEGPPCVVLASPGFLQTGPSRELLELMAPDPKNGLIVTGYSVEGTMARVSSLSIDGRRFFLVHYLDSCNTIHFLPPSPSLVIMSRLRVILSLFSGKLI